MGKRLLNFGMVALAYGAIYILCAQLFPLYNAYGFYTPDWAARNFLAVAALVSAVPALLGWVKFPYFTLAGYALGVVLGELLGGFQREVPPEFPHYGWAVCIGVYLLFAAIGAAYEIKIRKARA